MTLAIICWQLIIFASILLSRRWRALVCTLWVVWTLFQVFTLPLSILQFITIFIAYHLTNQTGTPQVKRSLSDEALNSLGKEAFRIANIDLNGDDSFIMDQSVRVIPDFVVRAKQSYGLNVEEHSAFYFYYRELDNNDIRGVAEQTRNIVKAFESFTTIQSRGILAKALFSDCRSA